MTLDSKGALGKARDDLRHAFVSSCAWYSALALCPGARMLCFVDSSVSESYACWPVCLLAGAEDCRSMSVGSWACCYSCAKGQWWYTGCGASWSGRVRCLYLSPGQASALCYSASADDSLWIDQQRWSPPNRCLAKFVRPDNVLWLSARTLLPAGGRPCKPAKRVRAPFSAVGSCQAIPRTFRHLWSARTGCAALLSKQCGG